MIHEQDTRTCTRCQATLAADLFAVDRSKASGHKSWCKTCDSARCRDYYRRKPRKQQTKKPRTRDCETCGAPFDAIKAQRFCCVPCRDKAKRQREAVLDQPCGYCAAIVHRSAREARRYPTAYCDKGCAQRARTLAIHGYTLRIRHWRPPNTRRRDPRYKLRLIQWQPTPPRVWVSGYCAECDTPFVSSQHSARYCSKTCAKRCRRRTNKKARDKRIRSAAKRDRIGHNTLARRDRWRCHICKHKVTRSTWSIDHLVPLSAGGSHTWDNVALAHHRCNSLRSDTGAAQLLLIGQ